MSLTRINVDAGGNYPVLVGQGLLGELPELLGNRVEKVLVIHPRALRTTGETVRDDLAAAGLEAVAAEIPDAEEAKHVQVAAFCWQVLGQSDFTRTDAIVTVGGGAVSDLGGFVAATWLRGIKVIHIPTTVLGMVDAAVGGKTGINTAEGKNLVGSFHAPAGVLVDLDTLGTLPENELFTGLAEVVKTGFIADPAILDLVANHAKEEIADVHGPVLRELIERSIRVKAEVVSGDFKESGRREILNYGHTLGHAIEHKERYQWRHGAAVSVGMVFAAEVASMIKSLPYEVVDLHRELLGKLGLPVGYRSDVWPQLLDTMKRDKKARGAMLRMVLLSDIGEPSTVEIPDASILFTAYQEIGEDSPTVSLGIGLGLNCPRPDGRLPLGLLDLPSGAFVDPAPRGCEARLADCDHHSVIMTEPKKDELVATTNDLKNGLVLNLDNQLWQVLEFQHVKPGKGPAFVRTKLKNVISGKIIDKTFNAGTKVETANVDRRDMQYLYHDGTDYVFMDAKDYDQVNISAELVGDAANYMLENQDLQISFHEGTPLSVELPPSVELTITHTEPGLQGDRSTGGSKPATLETGYEIQVPLFLEEGVKVKVDTRSGDYLGRVK